MANLISLTECDDGTCCCLSPRSTAALISLINLMSCFIEFLTSDSNEIPCCEMKEHLDSLKYVLFTLFEMANTLLLLGSIFENALLVQIYLWYMLGFIIMSFVVTILDFCFRIKNEGAWTFVSFIPEVIFLFVTFRCLPLVDTYKKGIEAN